MRYVTRQKEIEEELSDIQLDMEADIRNLESWFMKTREPKVQDALIRLGWIPPRDDTEYHCTQIYAYYGLNNQALKASEECSELAAALSKFVNHALSGMIDFDTEISKNVCEEIADVEIMLAQIKHSFDRNEIDRVKQQKILRILGHIEQKRRMCR